MSDTTPNSRSATPGSGTFVADGQRVISIKDGRDLASGLVTVADMVPANADAVTFNVTETTAPSFLAVGPGDATEFKAASVNWTGGGATVGNGTASKLDGARQVTIFSGPNGSFHAVIDVTGYYLQPGAAQRKLAKLRTTGCFQPSCSTLPLGGQWSSRL